MTKASKKVDKPEREPSVVLKPTHKAVAEALLDGETIRAAAEAAGVTERTAYNVKNATDVREYLDKNRSELSNALQINRGEIVAGMMEAIDLAKLIADPGSMIRGYTEIAKMLGLYAPEVKEVHITMGQRAIANKYEAMSDEDLLKIAEGNVVDGEFTHVRTH